MTTIPRTTFPLLVLAGLLVLSPGSRAVELPFGSTLTVSAEIDQGFSVAVADLDGDGDLDALSASRNDNKLAWYENTDGMATFGPQQIIDATGLYPEWVSAGDIDQDGDTDVLGAWYGDDKIAWYENANGDGSAWVRHDVAAAGGPGCVQPADIDHDGDLDLVACLRAEGRVAVFLASAPGSFSAPAIFVTPDLGAVMSAATADLDRDGDLDIVAVVEDPAGEIRWYDNQNGDGTTWAEATIDSTFPSPGMVRTADLDSDGDADVIAGPAGNNEIVWHENTDAGSSWAPHQIGTVASPQGLNAADVDQDCDVDIVSTSSDANTVSWHENVDGAALSWIEREIGPLPQAVDTVAADIDKDGDVDVMAISTKTPAGSVIWHRNERMRRSTAFWRSASRRSRWDLPWTWTSM